MWVLAAGLGVLAVLSLSGIAFDIARGPGWVSARWLADHRSSQLGRTA